MQLLLDNGSEPNYLLFNTLKTELRFERSFVSSDSAAPHRTAVAAGFKTALSSLPT